MIIREFTERDIDEITSLMKNLCTLKEQEFDEERWRNSLEKEMEKNINSEVIVAFNRTSNQVLGMGQCSIKISDNDVRFGYISNLIVKEEKRRTGIGEMIIRHIIDYFKRNHIESIRLALKPNLNNAAKTLFVKLGFQEMIRVYELRI
ncbi:MAG: GNAT family N-acetyltransferase [Promethearchaeota archaeon]